MWIEIETFPDQCVFSFIVVYGHTTYPHIFERQYWITRYIGRRALLGCMRLYFGDNWNYSCRITISIACCQFAPSFITLGQMNRVVLTVYNSDTKSECQWMCNVIFFNPGWKGKFKRRCSVVKTPELYFGGSGLESRPRNRLSWLKSLKTITS
jgi:hypothetical protein